MRMSSKFKIAWHKYLIIVGLFIYAGAFNTCSIISDPYELVECAVEILGPENTVFNEGESITFSAHVEHWRYADKDKNKKYGMLEEVIWESDIDGRIHSQHYDEPQEGNTMFSTISLSPGNHTIKCWVFADEDDEYVCNEKINIEIKEGFNIDDFPNCLIKIFTIDYYDTPTGGDTIINQSTFWGSAKGTWEDAVFTATISDQDALNNITGTIEIIVDAQQRNVISFYAKESATGISSDYERVHILQGTGPIPLDYVGQKHLRFALQGEGISSVLQIYSDDATGSSNGSAWYKTLVGFDVNSESVIEIEFDNYE